MNKLQTGTAIEEELPAANKSDYTTVVILIEDRDIAQLFSDLIDALGSRTQIANDVASIPGGSKVVTEPRLFSKLPPEFQVRALVIGDKQSLDGIEAICLERPLTESKIDQALAAFLTA